MHPVVYLFSGMCSLLPCTAAASAQTSAPVQAQRLTEAEAVARFLASDVRVRAVTARIEEVRAMHTERTLWPNPSVTYSRESVLNAHDNFLLARQEFSLSGRRQELKTAGERAVEVAQADLRFATIQLQAQLREAYTQLLLAQERETALKGAMDSLQKLIGLLRAREEAGEGSSYDRMRGARALLDFEADRAAAATARARAQGQLAGFLGKGVLPETLVAADTLESAATLPPVTALIAQALSNRGDYRATELSIAQFEAEHDAATRLRVPTPTVTGGWKHSDTSVGSGSGYLFSVDVTLPLFSNGQAAAALARASRTRAEAQVESWRARIEAEVRAAHTVLVIHQERAVRYRQSAAQIAEPLATIGRVGYEEGELGILELLDAERQAVDARLRILELAADTRRAAIELDRVIGVELKP